MQTKLSSKFSKLYFPGMISLIVLPLVCVVYLFENKFVRKYGMTELFAYNNKEFSKKFMHPSDMLDVNTYRKYDDISFTGNAEHDIKEHTRMKMLLKLINTRTDFLDGLRITFNTHSKYKDVVSVIDDFHQNCERLNGFAMIDNKIFIYQIKPEKVEQPIAMHPIEVFSSNDVVEVKPRISFFKTFKDRYIDFWPSAFAFIAMIGFTLSKKRYYHINT